MVSDISTLAQVAPSFAMTANSIGRLTKREREIIELIAQGMKNKEIAARLSISPATVRHHLSAIFAKLDVPDRLKLVVFAYAHGLATPLSHAQK
jgi:DNA-binding NarL/FixJ family response regulator